VEVEAVKIITEGKLPEPPRQPWYLAEPMACPRCGCVFQLDETDLASPMNMDGPWNVRTEKSLNGKSEATGPCPFCHKQITISRPNLVGSQ
jgi:hypothetical protein